LGSLRFTKARMRWMIWPGALACLAGLLQRASRSSSLICLPLMREIMPLQ
jgi:hypothetical protein